MEKELIKTEYVCNVCKKQIMKEKDSCSTGYAENDKKEKICYTCCAAEDIEYMKNNDRITLYLNSYDKTVTNWPGTLKIPVKHGYIREGRHNIARVRYDVWFSYAGKQWHGVQYGDLTQLVHCKALKQKAA